LFNLSLWGILTSVKGLPILLMLAFALTRWPGLWPEDWKNFSAAYGLMFCAGVYFPKRLIWLPLATLLVTDVLLNLFYYHVSAFSVYMAGNYAGYVVLMVLGRLHSAKSSWLRLVSGGLVGAFVFYILANTMAWLQDSNYPKTWAGWLLAMTTGVPGWPPPWMFLRNTLFSGGLFAGLFAGAMKLSEQAEEAAKEAEEKEPEEAEEAPTPAPEESKS
jgi:hypothetical protein